MSSATDCAASTYAGAANPQTIAEWSPRVPMDRSWNQDTLDLTELESAAPSAFVKSSGFAVRLR
jgi:hypothetical protein